MRFLTSVFVAAILAATQATAEPEAVEFADLADPLAVAFEDPYATMGADMLSELKLLVQSDEKLAGTDLDEETRTRLEARRTSLYGSGCVPISKSSRPMCRFGCPVCCAPSQAIRPYSSMMESRGC
jgi:hypothetical protein